MKKLSALFILFTIALTIVGCGQKGVKTASGNPDQNNVNAAAAEPNQPQEEIWDGTAPSAEVMPDFFADAPETNAFPASVIGLWDAELFSPQVIWQFRFEPDGSIKWLHHTLAGAINMEEGGSERINRAVDGYYVFTMGPCEARYIPDTNTLKVKIILDYFIMKIPDGQVEGRQEDYFEGPVSMTENGLTWGTKWRFFRWIKNWPVPDINYMKENPEPLIFVKIDPNSPPVSPPLK